MNHAHIGIHESKYHPNLQIKQGKKPTYSSQPLPMVVIARHGPLTSKRSFSSSPGEQTTTVPLDFGIHAKLRPRRVSLANPTRIPRDLAEKSKGVKRGSESSREREKFLERERNRK